MLTCKKAALALALSSAVAAPVYAAASSSASLSNFTYALYDLNLSDGVVPGLTWLPRSEFSGFASSQAFDNGVITAFDSHSKGGNGNLATTASTPLGQAAAGITPWNGSNSLPGGALQASGSTQGATLPGYGSEYSSEAISPYNWGSFNFSLTAATLVVFSASSFVTATTTVGYDSTSERYESATGQTFMLASGGNGGGWQSVSDESTALVTYIWDPVTNTYSGDTRSRSGQLAVSFINSGDAPLNGQFSAYVNTGGYSYVAVVSEPETYAMVMAGLGMIGGMARRRRQK